MCPSGPTPSSTRSNAGTPSTNAGPERGELLGVALRGPARALAPGDRAGDGHRVDVAGRDRRAGPAPADVGAVPAGPGLAAQRADLEQVGRRDVDVRERMVGRDEAVVAPPELDRAPTGSRRGAAAPRAGGRSPPASSPRSSPSGAAPRAAAAPTSVRAISRAARSASTPRHPPGSRPGSPRQGVSDAPASSAAIRSAPTATGSRPPASIASASRSSSLRRSALKPRSRIGAVAPDPGVDRVLLGGDVGAELGAAAVGPELDPERRARRHFRLHRPDRDRPPGSPAVPEGRRRPPGARSGVGAVGDDDASPAARRATPRGRPA